MRKTMPRSLLTALGKSLNPLMSDYVFYYGCSNSVYDSEFLA